MMLCDQISFGEALSLPEAAEAKFWSGDRTEQGRQNSIFAQRKLQKAILNACGAGNASHEEVLAIDCLSDFDYPERYRPYDQGCYYTRESLIATFPGLAKWFDFLRTGQIKGTFHVG